MVPPTEAVAFVLLSLYAVVSWCQELSADVCLGKGFSSHLQCSSCKELPQFHLEPLIESCGQCCHPDVVDSVAKPTFPFAQLVVCG